jgi:hypothetical protein
MGNICGTWVNKGNGSKLSILDCDNDGDHFKIEFFDKVLNTTLYDEKVLLSIIDKDLNCFKFVDSKSFSNCDYILFRNDNEIELNFKGGSHIVFNLLSKKVEFSN